MKLRDGCILTITEQNVPGLKCRRFDRLSLSGSMRRISLQLWFVCGIAVLCLHLVHTSRGKQSTYGRHFVFPVPSCSLDFRPFLLVTSAREGLTIELVVSGLFSEIVRTNIAQFTRFELPCRGLKTSGITRSGGISVYSSDDVMLHVTYHHDNFIVYPVSSLGWNYTVYLPRTPCNPYKCTTSIAITGVKMQTAVQINIPKFPGAKIQFGEQDFREGETIHAVLNESDTAVVTCARRLCRIFVQGSEPVFVLAWNTAQTKREKLFIEQFRPDITWGRDYVLPLPTWADDQLLLAIVSGSVVDSNITVRTEDGQAELQVKPDQHVTTTIAATNYIHLTASSTFHVMFLIRDAATINDTYSLISGVPIGQYLPMRCDANKGQKGSTTIAYEEFIEEMFTVDVENSSVSFSNYSSRQNLTIVNNVPRSYRGSPKLNIPFLKNVLGAYSVYLYNSDLTGRQQIISGGSQLQAPYSACAELDSNQTVNNETHILCLQEILDEFLEASNDDIPDLDTELFSFIGCTGPDVRRHVSLPRGRLKNRGITASVIAVIVSIVVAVIAVISFIIGVVIIDLTDDQRPMRQARVMPIEDEPPPPDY